MSSGCQTLKIQNVVNLRKSCLILCYRNRAFSLRQAVIAEVIYKSFFSAALIKLFNIHANCRSKTFGYTRARNKCKYRISLDTE